MGLFGKLKDSMHGGVRVQVQAPSSVPADQVIPVTVNVSADSSQTIKSVKAEIKAQAREQGIMLGGGGGQDVGIQDSRSTYQTVAQVESREPFTIGPGETKTVNLQLYINGNAAGVNPLGQFGNTGGALGGALQAIANVAQNFDHISYIYSVHASADVDGVSLDPSDKQPIQILPPAGAGQPPQAVANVASPQNVPVATPQPAAQVEPEQNTPPNTNSSNLT